MSGGVRNLRAMFENKDTSTSPPADRGRSPGGSTGVASNGTSPRPLSKIRTSFVTVEKSGQMGLQLRREHSGEPSMAKRRTSFSIDEEDNPKDTAARKESIATEFNARKNSSVIEETIPESAIETPSLESDRRLGAPKAKAELKKTGASTDTASAGTSNGHTNGTAKPTAVTKTVEKATNRPAPISTAKTTTASKMSPTKSPLPKTPTTPRGRGRPATVSKKEPDKKPEKTSRGSLAPSQSSQPVSRPATTSGSASRTRIQPSPPQTGFVKPKPRSPTRPVKLPTSLTAHTASSGSKTATAPPPTSRQSLSRASGNVQGHHAVTRSPSRASTTTTTLNRKTSTLNKTSSRPSLGPPPSTLKKQSSRQSLPHSTAPADDGFLARMMRPTTSSASKTLEKQPETPPKRAQSVRRPATSDGPSRTREAPKTTSAAPKSKAASSSKPAVKETKPAPIVTKKEAPEDIPESTSEPVKSVEPEIPEIPEVPEIPEIPASPEPAAVGAAFTQAGEVYKAEVEEAKKTEEVIPKAHENPIGKNPVADHAAEEGPIFEEEPTVAQATLEEPVAVEEPTVVQGTLEEPVVEEEPAEPVPEKHEVVVPLEVTEPAKEVPNTIEPPTPVSESIPAKEEIKETQPDAPEVEEEEVEAEPEPIKETKIEAPAAATVPVLLPVQEIESEPKPEVIKTEPEVVEDPEDVKAREEIARLNAEVMKAAEAEAAES